uniref:NOPS domain-containing protein n=1 Tax=Heterorhabditis bacteriophora TaxID=37862 RepID=A0A1I7XBN0_HETBA
MSHRNDRRTSGREDRRHDDDRRSGGGNRDRDDRMFYYVNKVSMCKYNIRSPKPLIVEVLDPRDEDDGLAERMIPRTPQLVKLGISVSINVDLGVFGIRYF